MAISKRIKNESLSMNISKKQIILLLILVILLFFISCNQTEITLDYANPNIQYSGRIDTNRINAAELFWSGSSIKINFEGKSISALMKDETGDNYYNIIIDRDSVLLFRPDTKKQYYDLVTNLNKGKHSIEIFKRTEWNRGKTTFYGFQINGNAKIFSKDTPQKRKIEFYGNSITAGYGIEDFVGDSPDSIFTNNYLTYAALTARHFDAQYSCICKSGIGIMISWFPSIMPEIYDRLNPTDSTSLWNFSRYTPDIVVINLFQNDSWLVNLPNHDEFKRQFGNTKPNDNFIIKSYQNFVSAIRSKYPDAHIICTLGSMDATKKGSKWPSFVNKAVSNLNDDKIYSFFMKYKKKSGHPKILEHANMANDLINFIDDNIIW